MGAVFLIAILALVAGGTTYAVHRIKKRDATSWRQNRRNDREFDQSMRER